MAVTVQQFVTLGPQVAEDLQLAMREAVNACALEITKRARIAVRRAIGDDQKLSHMSGGTKKAKIQPYYLPAESTTRPQAICRVKGPWQIIERPRKGGYQVKAKRKSAKAAASLESFGLSPGQALKTPQGPRGGVKPGPITTPLAPVSKTFARADRIIDEMVTEALDKSAQRRLGARL